MNLKNFALASLSACLGFSVPAQSRAPAAARQAETPAYTVSCLDRNGDGAATLSFAAGERRTATLEVTIGGTFPWSSDEGTIGDVQFIGVHSFNADDDEDDDNRRFVVPISPNARELVVTLLPQEDENNKTRIVCQLRP